MQVSAAPVRSDHGRAESWEQAILRRFRRLPGAVRTARTPLWPFRTFSSNGRETTSSQWLLRRGIPTT